ncbi:MAG: hypothetical protein HC927_10125 [Deltaproteobacteria bacterium]|nr:hypothetical protein [Deltaproteobacteria bacterium]
MDRSKLLPYLPALLSLSLLPACNPKGEDGDDEIGDTGTETTDTTGTETAETSETSETAETTDTGIEEPDPLVDWPTLPCDSLVPEYCTYPFPNNVFTAADSATVTGRRLALATDSLPIHKNGTKTESGPFNELDGFSPGLAMLTYLPNASTTGLPTWLDIDASLADDSPTVVLNAETGERVAHFAEIDVSLPNEDDGTFMIRPVERLADNTRYIVAIRNVQNKDARRSSRARA